MKKRKRKNGLQNVEKDGDWEMKKNQQNKLQNIVLGFRFPVYCNVMLLIYRRFAWFE